MRTRTVPAALCFLLACSTTAFALPRSFVSTSGNDANPCTPQLPCRSFVAAIAVTDGGGEMVALDSGGYGAFTVSNAIRVVAPDGVHAAITAMVGDAVTVNAPGAIVIIRNLALIGNGGQDGIQVDSAISVHLERISTVGFSGSGVNFVTQGHLTVKEGSFRVGTNGIRVSPGGGSATAGIEGVVVERNTSYGVVAGAGASATVRKSAGFQNQFSYAAVGASARIFVEDSVSAFGGFNSAGVMASSGGTAWASNCTLTGHSNGMQNLANSATVLTRGNNTIEGNTDIFTGTVGTYPGR